MCRGGWGGGVIADAAGDWGLEGDGDGRRGSGDVQMGAGLEGRQGVATVVVYEGRGGVNTSPNWGSHGKGNAEALERGVSGDALDGRCDL